jgi:hypothetical protein
MWKIASVTVNLTDNKTSNDESLTWGYDGKKTQEDFAQMILFEIAAHLASRNDIPTKETPQPPAPTLPAEPALTKEGPRAPTNRPARSLATAGKKLQGRKH